jgi:hypothetical protein
MREATWVLLVDDPVGIPMAGYFMAFVMNTSDEPFMVLGNPSQAKKGCLDAVLIKKIKEFNRVLFYGGRLVGPGVRVY